MSPDTGRRAGEGASARPLRVGILGCGYIADLHLQALRRLGPVDVVAADIDPVAADRLAALHGGCAIEPEALYARSDLDVAYLCTPHDVRLEPLERLTYAASLVVCEKPLALSAAEAELVRARLGERGRRVTLAFNQRFMPGVRELRTWLSAQRSRLRRIRIDITTPPFLDGWAGTVEHGGGIVVGAGSHAIDLWRYLFGRETVKVRAAGTRVRVSEELEHDTAVFTLADTEGTISTITVQDSGSTWWSMAARRMLDIDVRLDTAAARAGATTMTTWDDDLMEVRFVEQVGAEAGDFLEEWGYVPMARAILARLEHDAGPGSQSGVLADLEDGVACAHLVEQVRGSIADHGSALPALSGD